MVLYKYYYFNYRTYAEAARLIFAYAKVPFDDVRLTDEQWKELKNEMPFGQIPVLDADGKKIGQSRAICRYLARQFGLAGKTPLEEAVVDSVVDQHYDYLNELKPVFQAYMDKEKKEIGIPARDKFFGHMKNFLSQSKSGFLVGESLTYADLYVADCNLNMNDSFEGYLDGYPEVEKHARMVHELPGIKEYCATRPVTPF